MPTSARIMAGAGVFVIAALGVACGSSDESTSSTTSPTTSSTSTSATAGGIDAKDLFVNGKPSTGAVACGGCHALAAAGTTGTAGPDLDAIAPDDDAAALVEMIVSPNAEVVDGFAKDVMPQDYGTSLTADEVQALADYIDRTSAHAE